MKLVHERTRMLIESRDVQDKKKKKKKNNILRSAEPAADNTARNPINLYHTSDTDKLQLHGELAFDTAIRRFDTGGREKRTKETERAGSNS